MNLLILKGFNNYFNRKIKRYTEVSDYEAAVSYFAYISNYNFNPNDSVRTVVVLGKGETGADKFFDFETTKTADYLICYKSEFIHTEGEPDVELRTIESRWFITEVIRTRGGQYEIHLKRDTIADHFDSLFSSPAFIKKGHVSDDNPFIFNDEGVTVNQKKSNQEPLMDGSGSAWLVGYMPKGAGQGGAGGEVDVQVPAQVPQSVSIEEIASEFNIDPNDLSIALTTAKDNPSYFINDNIEVYATIDYPGLNNRDSRVGGGSQNFLSTFTYGSYNSVTGNTQNDVLAFENWSGVEAQSNVRTALKNYWISALSYYGASIKSQWKDNVGHPFFTKNLFNRLVQLQSNNTLIYKGGKYYRVRLGDNGVQNTSYYVNKLGTIFANVVEKYKNDYNTWASNTHYDPTTYIISYVKLIDQTGGKVRINYNELTAYFYLEEVSVGSEVLGITFKMSTTRNACIDQVYDMFAIPFGNVKVSDGDNIYDGIGEYAQRLAVAIAEDMASDYKLYDLQLLPYCPIPEIAHDGQVNLDDLPVYGDSKSGVGYDYDLIRYQGTGEVREVGDATYVGSSELPQGIVVSFTLDTELAYGTDIEWGIDYFERPSAAYGVTTSITDVGGHAVLNVSALLMGYHGDVSDVSMSLWYKYSDTVDEVKSVVIYPRRASFLVNINKELTMIDSMKIESICNNYRLVSPNYQGSFDFNVAKNGGSVKGFFAECTYKPYTPYIKVSPQFAGLYGTDYDDCRGLICGGDFSLGRVNSAWQEYQLQNKNYQNIFNREIQNLNVNYDIARQSKLFKSAVSIAGGTVGGAISGGVKGSSAGGYGAAAGALFGAAAGALVPSLLSSNDLTNMERQMIEQRQFATDKFSYQLGNIQAIPYTITKVGSFDIDSAIFPFIEYYTCTDEEKTALEMKFQYEGYTLGIVDLLGDYMIEGQYLQADLIRNEEITDDSHLLEDIYVELSKGVYF